MSQHGDSPKGRQGTTRTVAGNTAWYAFELGVALFQRLIIGVPVARMIGPEQLGYFAYVQWLTTISGLVGTVGIPMAARKYIAEYMANGHPEIAARIYKYTWRLQLAITLVLVAIGMTLVFTVSDRNYLIPSAILVFSMLPRMLLLIPANANVAVENIRGNVPAAVGAATCEAMIVGVSLWQGWGLTGVAAAQAVSYLLELAGKTWSVRQWLSPAANGVTLPAELKRRMTRFSGQSMALMALNLVVWDRSDMVFLKMLNSDPRQVTFFHLAFTFVDRILVIPKSFAFSVGANMMVGYTRDREKLNHVTALAARYSLLFSAPVMLGLAAVSGPLMRMVYGEQYLPVIPVLMIGASLAVLKPLLDPPQYLLQAAEKQGFLIGWGVFCGLVNVALDVALIPLGAAQGAMWANGLAQALTIAGIWVKVSREFGIGLPWGALVKIVFSGVVMGAGVYWLGSLPWPPFLLLLLQVASGAVLYPLVLRMTGVLDQGDRRRLDQLASAVPRRLRRGAEALVNFVAGPLEDPA